MPVQTSSDYDLAHGIGYEGGIADAGPNDTITRTAEDSDIKYGRAVIEGTSDSQAELALTSGTTCLGITVDTTAGVANASDAGLYEENSSMTVLRAGRIFAVCEDGCSKDDPVYFRFASGTGTEIGALRTDADTDTATLITGAKWKTTAAAGGIAIVQLPW